MTQEDKKLVLRYLCMALPYKVKVCLYEQETCILLGIDGYDVYLDVDSDSFHIESIKPYLRPMSSMTEEEKIEFNNIPSIKNYQIVNGDLPWDVANYKQIQWLLKKHFDFMGLIPQGLAIEITKDNNPYNTTEE